MSVKKKQKTKKKTMLQNGLERKLTYICIRKITALTTSCSRASVVGVVAPLHYINIYLRY